MIQIDDWVQVRRKAEELKSRRDEAAGRLKEIKARLRKEFGCASVKAARRLYKKLFAEEIEAAAEWNRALKRFKKCLESKGTSNKSKRPSPNTATPNGKSKRSGGD